MKDDNHPPTDYADKPLIYSCSGCSSAAQLANHLALRMDREGTAEMSCIVGLGGDVRPLVLTGKKAAESGRPIIMIDGCPLQCGRHTLARHSIEPDLHWDLSKKDVRKAKHVDFEPEDAQRLQSELTGAIETLHADESPSPLAGDGGGAFSGFDIGQGAEGQSFTGLGRHDGNQNGVCRTPKNSTELKLKGNGMNSLATVEREVAALGVVVTEDELTVSLVDGRRISVPLAWYPRLSHASEIEREKYELIGRGTGIHWPLIDEDLSVSGILKGNPSYESEKSLSRWLNERESIKAE